MLLVGLNFARDVVTVKPETKVDATPFYQPHSVISHYDPAIGLIYLQQSVFVA